MNPYEATVLIAVLLYAWWVLRRSRATSKARYWIRRTRRSCERGSWMAEIDLQDAYDACQEAGMVEEYMDLHEWFYGRKG